MTKMTKTRLGMIQRPNQLSKISSDGWVGEQSDDIDRHRDDKLVEEEIWMEFILFMATN